MSAPEGPTLASVLDGIGWNRETPLWPADMFALAGTLLAKSGVYTRIVDHWPPGLAASATPAQRRARAVEWVEDVRSAAAEWRSGATAERLPSSVARRWNTVATALRSPLASLARKPKVVDALLEICALADEACQGLGVPGGTEEKLAADSDFVTLSELLLFAKGTLCQKVPCSVVKVLPKLHTPQLGMTLRSLTHHVALVQCSEVSVDWFKVPAGPAERAGMNVLVVPWPLEVTPRQFHQTDSTLHTMPDGFGFFSYEPSRHRDQSAARLGALIDKAKALVGEVHAVVLPELAVTEAEYQRMRHEVLRRSAAFIAGVQGKPIGHFGQNYCAIEVPTDAGNPFQVKQAKHHRWQLERSQILNYGLGARLNHQRRWWENISVQERKITFLSMNPWLTLTTLLCEDLARQDPVADIVRTVGPNLVIALLMDGPQKRERWSARYATVLADDPGCSVLTVTSIGMAKLSRPSGLPPSRTVALWKDAKSGGPHEIDLPDGADGLVLTLSAEFDEEWAADGRGDRRTSGYAVLAGVHPVRLA